MSIEITLTEEQVAKIMAQVIRAAAGVPQPKVRLVTHAAKEPVKQVKPREQNNAKFGHLTKAQSSELRNFILSVCDGKHLTLAEISGMLPRKWENYKALSSYVHKLIQSGLLRADKTDTRLNLYTTMKEQKHG